MIKIAKGNILEATEDIIAHQTNCMGVMGGGLAKQIRDKYPNVYKEYKSFCNKAQLLFGNVQLITCSDGKTIANLFGQYGYGNDKQYTDYKALEESLENMLFLIRPFKKSIALPYKLGCGLAGGDWNIVYKIIEKVFEDYDVTIYNFE
jgi:O-acetyl-ADP-ribose deacetylase (regulator of RNase III)